MQNRNIAEYQKPCVGSQTTEKKSHNDSEPCESNQTNKPLGPKLNRGFTVNMNYDTIMVIALINKGSPRPVKPQGGGGTL